MKDYLPLVVILMSMTDVILILASVAFAYKQSSVIARLGPLVLVVGISSYGIQAVVEPLSLRLGDLVMLCGICAVYARRLWMVRRLSKIEDHGEKMWYSEPRRH